MCIKIIFGLSVIAAGTIGFLVGSHIVAKKLNYKIKDFEEQWKRDINKKNQELAEMKRIFVDSQPPEIAGERQKTWNQISEDLKKPPEERTESDPLKFKRTEEEKTNYNRYVEPYIPELEKTKEKVVIRYEAENGIVEITEEEWRETKNEYPNVDLQFHEATMDLYTDEEVLIDSGDIPMYAGYTQEELANRFLHKDEPDRIIIRNESHGCLYIIYLHQGVVK